MQKLTKEQLLTALMIKLDQIEYKIETLQSEFKVFMESNETIPGPPKPFLKGEDPEKIMICMACMMGDGREHSKEYCNLSDEEIFREDCK